MPSAAEVKVAILNITGKDLTNTVLKDAAERYNESFGSQWTVDANPFDPETEPDDHSAWPTNATADQIADFFAIKTRNHWQGRVYRGEKTRQANANEAAEAAAAAAASAEL